MPTDHRSISIVLAALLLAVAPVRGDDRAQPSLRVRTASRPLTCALQVNDTFEKLSACVTADGLQEHLAEFQRIADEHGGTRMSGSPGYDASATYVAETMRSHGYEVTLQEFEFVAWWRAGPSSLALMAPVEEVYAEDTDFLLATHSEAGRVAAPLVAVDLSLDRPEESTSGCEMRDYRALSVGDVALVQRGGCSFADKAELAASLGAAAVVVFNQGDTPERSGIFRASLGPDYRGGIPAFTVPFALGVDLAARADAIVQLDADVVRRPATTTNVFAETPGGDPGRVVMFGAHLDSIPHGAGIQDNGSGSAALLEVAAQFGRAVPRNKLRFAWWGAEEFGLIGSNTYVAGLTPEQRERVALYLNFDMIGSPNFARFVLDGDGSKFGLPGPPGSAPVESLFAEYYGALDFPFEDTRIDFRSDYAAFFQAGIPFGGLFTGAEQRKTAAQELAYGGIAGERFDPCYHSECDTLENTNLDVLELNADAIAFAVIRYASSTAQVDAARAAEKGAWRAPRPRRMGRDWLE